MFALTFFRELGLAAALAALLMSVRRPATSDPPRWHVGRELAPQDAGRERAAAARKVDALRYDHSQASHVFGGDLWPSHRIRAFAAGPPRRHRRYVERVWWPA